MRMYVLEHRYEQSTKLVVGGHQYCYVSMVDQTITKQTSYRPY
jgi:hypothetical protein